MLQKPVVFLGPSLPEARAREILDADYRPPAKRGDLFDAAKQGAPLICLIDGVFFQECSVAHKEVLYALDKGIKVIGASSMGALRASELDLYGMEGVGEIYRLYKSGELISDDEVALTFDPFTFAPLSEPLVNIRHNLSIASGAGILDSQSSELLLASARSLYFPERTWEEIIELSGISFDVKKRFEEFLARDKRDLKMEDAIEAIKRAKEILEGSEII
jgi:TfuA protein